MEERPKRKPITISILLLCALVLLVFSFYCAAFIEYRYTKNGREDAAVVWGVLVTLAFILFVIAHRKASKGFQFRALYPLVLLFLTCFSFSIGWVTSNVRNYQYSFVDYIYPDYVIRQKHDYPNHFEYLGGISHGSDLELAKIVLGAESVDWNKPVVLEISSDGGSARAGMLLGEFIEQYDVHVEIMDRCLSACTYALMYSDFRYVHPRAWIGFHAAYNGVDKDAPSYDEAYLRFYNEALDNRMMELGISPEFRGLAEVRSKELYYPSYEDMKEEGVVNQFYRQYLSSNKLPYYK